MAPPRENPAPLAILGIDDDPDVLDTFAACFAKEPGVSFVPCSSPVTALERLKTLHADAIFCDFSMPDMDGIEFLRTIRSRGNDAFFVLFTGRHLSKVAIDTLNSGGNYYLQKNVMMMDEMPRVLELIRRHRDLRAPVTPPSPEDATPVRSFIDNQFVPLCGFDRHGRMRYTNRFYDRELGGSSGPGQNFFAAIPDDERAEFKTHLASLTALNLSIHLLHHLVTGSGLKLILGNYRAFLDASGKVEGYTAVLTPVSGIISVSSLALHSLEEPRVQQEPVVQRVTLPPAESAPPAKKKKRVKEYFDELSESVEHVQYPVFAVDTAGKVIAWNRATAELTGVAATEILGKDGYAHAGILTGEKRPMLIDYIVQTPHDLKLQRALGIEHDGDVFTCDPETVRLQGKSVTLYSKGAGIYDAGGSLIAAVQSILVSSAQPAKKGRERAGRETYLGGISSIILKVTDRGVGGAIAGAIGSAVGGYGVYVTDRRLFVIHNPFLDARRSDSIAFGEFILGELFGTNVDTRPRDLDELERHKVFEVKKKEITGMVLRRPKLLAGSLDITTESGGKFRVYIDHARAFGHLEQVLRASWPEILEVV